MVLRENLPIMSREQPDVHYHGNQGCRNRARVAAVARVQTHVIVLIAELQVKRVQTFSGNSGWVHLRPFMIFPTLLWKAHQEPTEYAGATKHKLCATRLSWSILHPFNKRQDLGSCSRQCNDAASRLPTATFPGGNGGGNKNKHNIT